MRILKHVVWLIATAFIINGCATYCRNETECNLARTEANPVWDAEKLDEAFQFACELGSTSLIVATNGEVVRSMGELDKPLFLHSVRKAVLSAIVGQHVGTGPNQINLESTLAELKINDKPIPLTPLQQQTKVLHLIKSISGINHPAAGEAGLMEKEKDKRLGHKPNPPGTVWAYNNWDYNALTTIFQKETGLTIYEAFNKGIAEPLEMQDFNEKYVYYEYEKELSMHLRAGFKMSTRDLVKFGQLYLNKGKWNGKQIIPEEWINRITDDYTITGEKLLRSGHGYLWWVPVDNKSREMGIPEGTYFASGFGNQRIVVIPNWDTVIVHQVNAIDCLVSVIKKHETTLKGAIRYLYMCKFPLFSLREDCQECGTVGNFMGSGFAKIFSRIIDARIPKNQK
ncbi:MAG: serine hydrolase [Deltaproteobacteria bacterium]|nr:serine hydrolase [Deltaproteobacteria bacterium]